jgi:hypothetical protein
VDSFVNANRSTQLDDVKANVGQLNPFPQLPKKAHGVSATATAMQRVAGAGLVTGGKTLAVIIAECAQHRPLNAGCVHCASGMINLLADLRIHAAGLPD